MLLYDAMRLAECSICLQTILHDAGSSPAPSQSGTPMKEPPCSSRPPQQQQQHPQEQGAEGEFQITFAPGVPRAYALDETHTFQSALDMHHSMAKKRRKKSSRSNQNADSNSSTAGDPGIVVLPCGHLLHFLCAVQLYEYKEGATCPICRQPLKSTADFVLFSPRRWPGSTPQGIQVDECTNTSDKGSDDSSDDVQFTGERRLAAVDAYERLIRRNTDELKQRRRNLRGREQDLASSKEQLLDRCLTLEQSAADARRRCEVLTQQGAVGLERLVELRNVARETHASVNLMTAELATLTRQQGVLDRQLEKYSQKLRCCKSGRRSDTTDGEVDAPRGSGSSAPLQKRRLRRLEGGNMLSYYVSHN